MRTTTWSSRSMRPRSSCAIRAPLASTRSVRKDRTWTGAASYSSATRRTRAKVSAWSASGATRTQSSPAPMPLTRSERTARPTCPPTFSTPGSARSSAPSSRGDRGHGLARDPWFAPPAHDDLGLLELGKQAGALGRVQQRQPRQREQDPGREHQGGGTPRLHDAAADRTRERLDVLPATSAGPAAQQHRAQGGSDGERDDQGRERRRRRRRPTQAGRTPATAGRRPAVAAGPPARSPSRSP